MKSLILQDIGYFISPGDRSYDAIGLMRQFNEHTAAVVAEAQEVLRSGGSVKSQNEPQSDKTKNSQENVDRGKELGYYHMPSKLMVLFSFDPELEFFLLTRFIPLFKLKS